MSDFYMCRTEWINATGNHRCDNVNEWHECRCCCGEEAPILYIKPPEKYKGWRRRKK